MKNKSLKDISWLVTEEEYRKDPALSYSTLARYEREGFSKLNSLFDKIETPSLLLGSLVDTLITEDLEEYSSRYLVSEFPSISDNIIQIVKALFNEFGETHISLDSIPIEEIIGFASRFNYQPNWRPETRAKVIKEKGSEYYSLMFLAKDKTIISTELNNTAHKMCSTLKESTATKWYFQKDNPFENVERLYQLKFKAVFRGIAYRCMMDLAVVDYDKKTIQPIDLKTSGKEEYNFFKSFIDWSYSIQARLYSRIIIDNISKDSYFKDFEVLPYKFIVVNKGNLDPMAWTYWDTFVRGTLYYGKHKDIIIRDPEEIGEELNYYLYSRPKRPIGIKDDNSIEEWLNKL